MSDVLDSFVFSNFIVEAHPGKIKIYKPKVELCALCDGDAFIFINSNSIKEWFQCMRSFLFEEEKLNNLTAEKSKNVISEKSKNSTVEKRQCKKSEELIADVYNECQYYIRLSEKFEIEKKGFKPCKFMFSTHELSELIVAMSHMYISSLCLPSVVQLSFVMLMSYFESYAPIDDFEKTVEYIRKCNSEFYIKHFDTLSNEHNLRVSGCTIYSCLHKFEKHFVTLYRMRICTKIKLKKVVV